jgi:phosphatidylserine decarboxylase
VDINKRGSKSHFWRWITIIVRNTGVLIAGLFATATVLAVGSIFMDSALLVYESVLIYLLDIFLIWFFRDPEREPQGSGGDILSPADGKVLDIRGNTVCIFMNIHNVHINRAPISGTIVGMKYKKGGYIPAFCKDSSRNEQNIICIKSDYGLIRIVQIAGTITRRIDSYFNINDRVVRGERIGMIRFGSRVDITPPEGYVLTVKKGDTVRAAISIIAKANQNKEEKSSSAGE